MTDAVLPPNHDLSLEELVQYYHKIKPKFKYNDICRLITMHHGMNLSGKKLKEICRKLILS